jgi:hypothetical protein
MLDIYYLLLKLSTELKLKTKIFQERMYMNKYGILY